MARNLTCLLALLALFTFCTAQTKSSTPAQELEKYFQEAAKGKGYFISNDLLQQLSERQFKKIAFPNLESDNAKLRAGAITILKRKGLTLSESADRDVYIRALAEACKDVNSGNSGLASSALENFSEGDFSGAARDSIESLLRYRPFHFRNIIRLAGFVPAENTLAYLKESMLPDSSLSSTENWTVHLALARNGDTASLNHCLNLVKSVTVNDEAVTRLYSDLVYTRHPASYKLMLQGILSDERNCSSGNPYYEKRMVCAYQIMEMIAPTIINFPLESNKWGELEIKDYEKDLVTVRDWVRSEPQLQLRDDVF